MSITDRDLMTITTAAKRFGIGSVYLFGSALEDDVIPKDIDIAVKNVPPGTFFSFYAFLMERLSQPIDIVDLSAGNAVTSIIESEAKKIYG